MEGQYYKLTSTVNVSSFDEYNILNKFRCNNIKENKQPKVQLSPNSMINSFDDISSNLRSHITRVVK